MMTKNNETHTSKFKLTKNQTIAAVVGGMKKREEAKIHVEALQAISASLDAEIEPHTVNLEERTITLTGSVNDQYTQWREVLREIYRTETGAI